MSIDLEHGSMLRCEHRARIWIEASPSLLPGGENLWRAHDLIYKMIVIVVETVTGTKSMHRAREVGTIALWS